jgi:hypothetical protein
LDVSLFGREEDAADQFSSHTMLHFVKTEARRLILGTAYAYKPGLETIGASGASVSQHCGRRTECMP